IVLPRYRRIDPGTWHLKELPGKLVIPMGGASYEEAYLFEGTGTGGVPVYFVENRRFFDRMEVYGSPGCEYGDNRERAIFFSRAVLETLKIVDFKADVIHGHEWQLGVLPAYLKTIYRHDVFFNHTASVYTIHNIAHQGSFSADTVDIAGFLAQDFVWDKMAFYGTFNFMKVGLVYADKISTVSPSYAKEIQLRSGGFGLDTVVRARHDDLVGILNGIDYDSWNPLTDPYLSASYCATQPEGKRQCKSTLQTLSGLPVDSETLLVGMISRLDNQKGYDLLCAVLPQLIKKNIQIVILGRGDRLIEETLVRFSQMCPGKISVSIGFNEQRAHEIYAGADVFLMPSRYEPCGLGQMIAFSYGTVPLVTPVGGLKDTVTDFNELNETGNGFVMSMVDIQSLMETFERALKVHAVKSSWNKIVSNTFATDHSWEKTVGSYELLYQRAQEKHSQASRH
ncbi:MAG: glycogen/starch synthase, partial [Endomicrobiales bacterium]